MRVFLTGGAGFIGSHTLLEVLSEAHEVCVYDDFSNSAPEALKRVESLSNRQFETVTGNILDRAGLAKVMAGFKPDVVVL